MSNKVLCFTAILICDNYEAIVFQKSKKVSQGVITGFFLPSHHNLLA